MFGKYLVENTGSRKESRLCFLKINLWTGTFLLTMTTWYAKLRHHCAHRPFPGHLHPWYLLSSFHIHTLGHTSASWHPQGACSRRLLHPERENWKSYKCNVKQLQTAGTQFNSHDYFTRLKVFYTIGYYYSWREHRLYFYNNLSN